MSAWAIKRAGSLLKMASGWFTANTAARRCVFRSTGFWFRGRKGNTEGLGLENLGIEPSPQGTVPTGNDLSVVYPNIFACGDVAGPYQFTHMAAHQAWHAAVNGLFGQFKRFTVDYSVTPWVTFTSPEVGRVGLNEAEAREQGIDYEVTTYGLDDLDRAITESEGHGFIKVITPRGKDKILGATVAGEHGGELLTEFILAMKHKIGLNKILGTIHPYPTWNESVKFTAGEWKKAHAPQKVIERAGELSPAAAPWPVIDRRRIRPVPVKPGVPYLSVQKGSVQGRRSSSKVQVLGGCWCRWRYCAAMASGSSNESGPRSCNRCSFWSERIWPSMMTWATWMPSAREFPGQALGNGTQAELGRGQVGKAGAAP